MNAIAEAVSLTREEAPLPLADVRRPDTTGG